MDIERYREFIVLASELNYHRAAERAFTTQSSLSKHIAALEQHYGVRLFERDRSGVQLTTNGEALLEHALTIWNAYEESMALFRHDETRDERALVVGGTLDDPTEYAVVARTTEILSQLDAPVVPRFLTCASPFPEVQAEALRSGEVDVAVLQMTEDALAGVPAAGEFTYRHLFDTPMLAVVSERHALASRGRIALADLQGCRLVHAVGARMTVGWHMIERQLAAAGVSYTEKYMATSSAWDFMNADPGDAVFLIGKNHVKMRSASVGKGRTVQVPVDGLYLSYGAFFLKGRADAKVETFLDALERSYAEVNG